MRFPQTFIDDLRRQADIVRIISDYVSLKKKGANWMTCCPFHQEKTPSFSVSPAKEIFYCFGCQKGGSVFNFVMEIERVSFPEAVRIVAEKTGLPLPAMEDDKRFEARRHEADEIIQLNSWALEWWEAQLRSGSMEARAGCEYFAGRGITDETRKKFRLGFAPNSWDGLSSYLKGRGASPAQIERSGLVVKKETGGFYDRFRGRVIFPVMDAQGRPVAFGGRVLPGGGEPKYLNSPETAAYTKGRHLYGLHLTRDEIRQRRFAILVEGYIDLIIPFQFGIRNLVASLGTALTVEQAKLLGRFARQVVVNYDGDRAGIQASKRAIETLLAEDFKVKVLVLPDNADPDEFIRTSGVEEYHRRRGEAIPHIQFVLNQVMRDHNLRDPDDKNRAVEEMLPFVRAVPALLQKREYFDIIMKALHVEDAALLKLYWQAVKKGTEIDKRAVEQSAVRAKTKPPTVAEQRLLELLIHDAQLRHDVLPLIESDDYKDLQTAAIFRALKELDKEAASLDFDLLMARVGDDPTAAELIPRLWMSEPQRAEGEATDEVMTQAESCLTALRLMKAERRWKELETEIAAAERTGDLARYNQLVMERLDLDRHRNALSAHAQAAAQSSSSPS